MNVIKIYRVANGEELDVQGEREKANNSFGNHFVHIRDEDGEYFLVVIPPEIHEDFTQLDPSDEVYKEIHKCVIEGGLIDDLINPKVTDTIN